MIPAVSIIGHHDSGKTRLLARLIPALADRGLRVGAVKHAPHTSTREDSASDSAQLSAVGANPVLLVGEMQARLTWQWNDAEPIESVIDRHFSDCDLVLVEGFKHGPLPKIEVFRRGRDMAREPLAGEIDVVALVTDERVAAPDGTLLLSPRDLPAILDALERLMV